MSANRLYNTISIACFLGFCYLLYTFFFPVEVLPSCSIKAVTGYPCPSCGTTRSVFLLLNGNIIQSLLTNPFGLAVAVIMFVLPFWIVSDRIFKKITLFDFYKRSESFIAKRWIAIIMALLVMLNWIWNIQKGL